MSLLWLNGTLIDRADAKVSPFDHGFLYGDGVWEPLRIFAGKVFRVEQHLEALFSAASVLGIEIPLSRQELTAAIESTVTANDRTEGYIRVIVSRGPGTLGPDPRRIAAQVVVIAEEYQPFPLELYGHGLHAAIVPIPIDAEQSINRVRTLGRPHVVLAKQHALRNGCLEAIFTQKTGELVGTTEGFLFLIKDGAVIVAGGQPHDVTGFAVAAMAGDSGLVVAEYAVKLADLVAADEAFLAGTACGVIGIVRVDGQDIGKGTEGPVTAAIRDGYRTLTRGSG